MKTVDCFFFRCKECLSKRNYRDVVSHAPERSGKLVDMCCDPSDIWEKIYRKYAMMSPIHSPNYIYVRLFLCFPISMIAGS